MVPNTDTLNRSGLPMLASMADEPAPITADTALRYCADPTYRARLDAETFHNRRLANEAIDRGMAMLNARQAARWERGE